MASAVGSDVAVGVGVDIGVSVTSPVLTFSPAPSVPASTPTRTPASSEPESSVELVVTKRTIATNTQRPITGNAFEPEDADFDGSSFSSRCRYGRRFRHSMYPATDTPKARSLGSMSILATMKIMAAETIAAALLLRNA